MSFDPSKVLSLWQKMERLPGSGFLFHKFISRLIPYTGSIPFRIQNYERGKTHLTMPDKRAVRNHLDCIHAIALMNLAELSSGLATVSCFDPGMRGILKGLRIEYLKKARGELQSRCELSLPPFKNPSI